MKENFEWSEDKNRANIEKHEVTFEFAQEAFFDEHRIIFKDVLHSKEEDRFFCFGKVQGKIITVRFTYRNDKVRIFGAGFWRKGVKIYEQENNK